MALLLGTQIAQGQELFTVRETLAAVGSNIHPLSASANLPFNKAYAQLSPEQVQIVRSGYESMPEGYEPPYPEKGIKSIYTLLDKGLNSAARQVQGEVIASGQVDENGLVQSVSFHNSPKQDMQTLVAWVLMQVQFKPGMCGGKPCAMEFPITVDFQPRAINPAPDQQGIWIQFLSSDDKTGIVYPRRN